jgi:hypothetical protein
MRSPTTALLWEIWEQHRSTVAAIAGLTVVGRLVDFLETQDRTAGPDDSSPLTTLLAMVAFLLIFAVFNYTESGGNRGVGRFPRRLFTLPVTSLRLVAVPVLAGITSIELLYLMWMGPMSRGGSTTVPFVGVLLAAFIVFYLSALWTLERAGSLRLVLLGLLVIVVFAIGILPSFPPSPPPLWRSEIVLATLLAGVAVVAFLLSWRHVARLRAGGGRRAQRAESVFSWMAETTTARKNAFATRAAAQFWFEWRSAGIVLPALVGAVLLVVVMPMSWLARGSAEDTVRLLLAALAAPAVLAVPVGMAFSKPTFWSEDLAVPASVAVLPLSSEDLVAIKVKVAAMSAVAAWLVLLVFLAVWLSSWGNLDALNRLGNQLWALHGRSVAAVYGIAVLVAFTGVFLTWRFMVSRLWSGLSGNRRLFEGSAIFTVFLVIAAIASDGDRLPGWLLEDPARLAPLVWIAAVAVVAKYAIALYAWRGVTARYLRVYLLIWLAGTASFLALGLVLWGIARTHPPLDADRVRSFVVLLAFLAIPLARVGLAPSSLERNRHR